MMVKNISNFPVVVLDKGKQVILLPSKTAKVNGKSKHVKQLIKLGFLQKIKEEK